MFGVPKRRVVIVTVGLVTIGLVTIGLVSVREGLCGQINNRVYWRNTVTFLRRLYPSVNSVLVDCTSIAYVCMPPW